MPQTSPQPGNARSLALAAMPLVLAMALAAVLRFWGIDFGLPLLSNWYVRPDETLVVDAALTMLDHGGDPRFYGYPALMPFLCAAVFSLWHGAWAVLATAPPSPGEYFALAPSEHFLIARCASATVGTLTVGLVYALARRMASRRAAILAALLYAVAPLPVRDSHFAVTDTLVTALALGVCLALCAYWTGTARCGRRALIVGALVGAAVATKLSAAALIGAVTVVFVLQARRLGPVTVAKHLLAVALSASIVWVAFNPFGALRWRQMGSYLMQVSRAVVGGEGAPEADRLTALVQVWQALCLGPGEIVGLLIAIGVVVAAIANRRVPPETLSISAVAGAFLIPVLLSRTPAYRYLLPLHPYVAVLAGVGLTGLLSLSSRVRAAAAGLLIALALLPSLGRSIAIDRLLSEDDTRTVAGRWIEANVPTDVPVVVYALPECEPQLSESRASIARRVEYVGELYGDHAREVVSRPFRRVLRAQSSPSLGGREVFRYAHRLPPGAEVICLVTVWYPLANPVCDVAPADELPERIAGSVISSAQFRPLPEAPAGNLFDTYDAFFLPFSHLGIVERPGPNVDVRMVALRDASDPTGYEEREGRAVYPLD